MSSKRDNKARLHEDAKKIIEAKLSKGKLMASQVTSSPPPTPQPKTHSRKKK